MYREGVYSGRRPNGWCLPVLGERTKLLRGEAGDREAERSSAGSSDIGQMLLFRHRNRRVC